RQMFRGVATEKYLRPNWNLVASQFQVLEKEMPGEVKHVFLRYLYETLHYPDALQVGLARTMRQTMGRLEKNKWFAKAGVHGGKGWETADLVSTFTGLNYQANLGWNPGSIIRQYMQTLQTTMPIIGF